MTKIDLDAVLKSKAPKASRWIPGFVVGYLKRLIHQEEINRVIESSWYSSPRQFIHTSFKELGIEYTISGLEGIDPNGRYLFASNHPFGGMDGMMLADCLIGHFGDSRVIVNDLLMHIEPLRPLWVPVNKHGSQNSAYARRFEDVMSSNLPVLTFPAGLCSRRIDGKVTDLKWRTNFVKKAHQCNRQIVPIFVDGELSKFFYRLSNIRLKLGIKFNIEMLFLVDEMFKQRGKNFSIKVGKPISLEELSSKGNHHNQAEYVREMVYALK